MEREQPGTTYAPGHIMAEKGPWKIPKSTENAPTPPISSDAGIHTVHNFEIDEPNGRFSQGCCRGCGLTREFQNWLPETDFVTNTEHRFAT